jgi:HEAT repeat protein
MAWGVARKPHFVKLVVGEDSMTFEGQIVTWDMFVLLLANVPEPEDTGLRLVIPPAGLSSEELNDVKTRLSSVTRELGFRYLTSIDKHIQKPKDLTRGYFFTAPFNFNKEIFIRQDANGRFKQEEYYREAGKWIKITDETQEHKEWATVRVNSIRFKKSLFKQGVTAALKVGYMSWPRAKWQFTVRLLDDKGKVVAEESDEYYTSGYIVSGEVLSGSTKLGFSFGRDKNLSKATSFELTVVPVVGNEADVQIKGEENWGEVVEGPNVATEESVEQIVARIVSEHRVPGFGLWYGGSGTTRIDGHEVYEGEHVRHWERVRIKQIVGSYPELKTLEKRAGAVAPLVHRKLLEIKAGHGAAAERLTYLLGKIGTRESVPVLIGKLGVIEKNWHKDEAGMCAVIWALWELSGRPVEQTAAQWGQWWEQVKDVFVPMRERHLLAVRKDNVEELLAKLKEGNAVARERLVMLGPNALPYLLKKIGSLDDELRYEIAWVIDEIGEASQMPREIRRAYFVRRIQGKAGPGEVGRQFRRRVLTQQSFDDFCRMAVEAASSSGAGKGGVWHCVHWSGAFEKAVKEAGTNLEPAIEILISGLNDAKPAVRWTAIRISEYIGLKTDLLPAKLIEALESHWKLERDDELRYRTAFAFARFRGPEEAQRAAVIQKGLWSEREEIVRDCVRLSGFCTGMVRRHYNEMSLDRLVEFTHSEDDQIRLASVKALTEGATEQLKPHLERLCGDAVDEIRSECAMAMGRLKDPKHLPLLIKLSNDEKSYIRSRAFSELGDPAFRLAIAAIKPRLKDKDEMNRYEALDAIVDIGGSEALEVLIREVEQGNTFRGDIFDRLGKLTGQRFKTAEEWLKWWQEQQKSEVELEGSDGRKEPSVSAKLADRAAWQLAASESRVQAGETVQLSLTAKNTGPRWFVTNRRLVSGA